MVLVVACMSALLVAATVQSTYLRTEDDLVGECTVPLAMLMDQVLASPHLRKLLLASPPVSIAQESHTMLLDLQPPKDGYRGSYAGPSPTANNAATIANQSHEGTVPALGGDANRSSAFSVAGRDSVRHFARSSRQWTYMRGGLGYVKLAMYYSER